MEDETKKDSRHWEQEIQQYPIHSEFKKVIEPANIWFLFVCVMCIIRISPGCSSCRYLAPPAQLCGDALA